MNVRNCEFSENINCFPSIDRTDRVDRVKVCSSAFTKRLRHGADISLAAHSARESFSSAFLSAALCVARRCRTCAKLYVGAHKAVERETRKPRVSRHVGPCSLLSSLRDDLIIGRRTSTVERSIEMASDGGPGLYPGGKSPRRNQHDRGERPTRAYTYNATGIIPDYLRRSAISISPRHTDYSYIAGRTPS